jgi:hypothetical protein
MKLPEPGMDAWLFGLVCGIGHGEGGGTGKEAGIADKVLSSADKR